MKKFETEVIDIIQRAPQVKSFRFKVPDEVEFKPGQFFWLAIKVEGEEKEKPFSFSNSPTEKGYVEFTKRITQSDFSQTLDKMKVGDWARLRMPFGSFTFEGEHQKIAFLSGGVGITPIKSICKYVTDKKIPTDIVLLYGNRSKEEIIFKEDFDKLEDGNSNIRVVHFITSGDFSNGLKCSKTGHITEEAVQEDIPDYRERVFYLCGPPDMVQCMVEILKEKLGVDQSKIKVENFAGY